MNKLLEKGEKRQPRKWLPSKGAPGVIRWIREKWQTFKHAQNLLRKKEKKTLNYIHIQPLFSPYIHSWLLSAHYVCSLIALSFLIPLKSYLILQLLKSNFLTAIPYYRTIYLLYDQVFSGEFINSSVLEVKIHLKIW